MSDSNYWFAQGFQAGARTARLIKLDELEAIFIAADHRRALDRIPTCFTANEAPSEDDERATFQFDLGFEIGWCTALGKMARDMVRAANATAQRDLANWPELGL